MGRSPAGSDLPITSIEQIEEEVEALVGGPLEPPHITDDPMAVMKWVDGTVIDCARWDGMRSP